MRRTKAGGGPVGSRVALALALIAACAPGPEGAPGDDALALLLGRGGEPADSFGEGARIHEARAGFERCGSFAEDEDFSSGRYDAHRYRAVLPAGGSVEVRLSREAGRGSPALVVSDELGAALFDGRQGLAHDLVEASHVGGEPGEAEVTLRLAAAAAVAVDVHVTSWEALGSSFAEGPDRSFVYRLELGHDCSGPPPAGLPAVHAGIDRDGVPIPRAGLDNGTLRGVHGTRVEPHGHVAYLGGLPYVSGRVSWFGGPSDRVVSSRETGAITGERLRSLSTPLDPAPSVLEMRPEDYYYAAMRFDYGPAGIAFWRAARLLVVEPSTGLAVVVRPVDWGPAADTGRIIDVSPQVLSDLGLRTDDRVLVAFAHPAARLGPLR